MPACASSPCVMALRQPSPDCYAARSQRQPSPDGYSARSQRQPSPDGSSTRSGSTAHLVAKQRQPSPDGYSARSGSSASSIEADALGDYVVLSRAVVSRDVLFRGNGDVIAKVPVGSRVRVLEVRHCKEEQRIRGRLAKPAGWMSLLNTETGRRWAAKLMLCPLGHSLRRCDAALQQGNCAECQRIYVKGALLLCCQPCLYGLCMHCLKRKAPLQAWTYHVTAGVRINALGFVHSVVPPMRVMIRGVQPGSWADTVGMKPGDEMTAINSISVDQVTPQELESVLLRSRPLEFTFVYNGPETPAQTGTTTSWIMPPLDQQDNVTLTLVLQNVDFTVLHADTQLFASFKSIIRQAVATEAEHGVLRENVELAFSAGATLVVRCVLARLPEAVLAPVRARLSSSVNLGTNVTRALNRLNKIRNITTTGPVTVVKVEVEAGRDAVREVADTDVDVRKAPAKGQAWQPLGIARTLLRRLSPTRSPNGSPGPCSPTRSPSPTG